MICRESGRICMIISRSTSSGSSTARIPTTSTRSCIGGSPRGSNIYLFNSGPVTSNIVEGGAFWWGDRPRRRPTCSSISCPVPASRKASARCRAAMARRSTPISAAALARQRHLAIGEPADLPIVDPNILRRALRSRPHHGRHQDRQEIGRSRSFGRFVAREHFPGERAARRTTTRRCARHARSSYHPVGTCKMGVDAMAVVDPQLRVRGIDALARMRQLDHAARWCRPTPMRAAIAIAEKAADMIKGNR